MDIPLLSVCLITYNHVNFIKQAIDGVLMQKVDFAWELIIADDFSTDGTREIVLEYKNKYPDLIKLILQEKNVGAAQNFIDLITAPKSKYIAYFEGDDYWTDPLKLQKQVDFLETNPDFSICFHNVNVINESCPEKSWLYNDISTPAITVLDDLLNGANYIATNSALYRRKSIQDLPDWFLLVPFGDYALQLIAARQGRIGYINEVMGTYRQHQAGVYSSLTTSLEGKVKAYQKHCQFWSVIQSSGLINSEKIIKPMSLAIDNLVLTTEQALAQKNQEILLMKNSPFWRLRNKLLFFRKLLPLFLNMMSFRSFKL
jgi:glycosyltransferase involved in cell wall biosynthesis